MDPMEATNWKQWISAFLNARGLVEPDGRPLWAYRVTEAEFQEIGTIEKKLVWESFALPFSESAMLFTLHATELWRREYAGGAWTWDLLMPHFGMDESQQDYARRLVRKGADRWKIETIKNLQGRQYVATLFVNSGLPTKLVTQHHGSSLEDLVLKSVQRGLRFPDESDVMDGVNYFSHVLPNTLANEPSFLRMIGLWVLEIVSLVREHQLNKAIDPIRRLNEVDPNWGRRFPFEVSGDEMSAMLDRLLKQSAVYVPEERQFVNSFLGIRQLNQTEWQPVVEFKLLHVVSRWVLGQQLGLESLDDYYTVYLVADFGRVLLARLISSPFLQHNYEVNAQNDQLTRYGNEALSLMSIELEDQYGRVYELDFGVESFSLTSRPALFSERINGPIRLDGFGRVSTEKSEGYVLSSIPLEPLNEQTEIQNLGTLRGSSAHHIFHIRGTVGVGSGDDRFVIRTGDRETRAKFIGFFFEDLGDGFSASAPVLSSASIEDAMSGNFDYEWAGNQSEGLEVLRVFDTSNSTRELVWKEKILRTKNIPTINLEFEGNLQNVYLHNIPYRSVHAENPKSGIELATESIPKGFQFQIDELSVEPVKVTLLLNDQQEWSFKVVPKLHGASVTLNNQIIDACSLSQMYSATLNVVATDLDPTADRFLFARLTLMSKTFKSLSKLDVRLGELDPETLTFSCSLSSLSGITSRLFKTRGQSNDLLNLEVLLGKKRKAPLMQEVFRIYQYSAHPLYSMIDVQDNIALVELTAKTSNGEDYKSDFKVVTTVDEREIGIANEDNDYRITIDLSTVMADGLLAIPQDSYVSPFMIVPGENKSYRPKSLGGSAVRGDIQKARALMNQLCKDFTHPSWGYVEAVWNDSRTLSAKSHPFWAIIASHQYPASVISRVALSDDSNLIESIAQFWNFFSEVGILWQAVTMKDWVDALAQGNLYLKMEHPKFSALEDDVAQMFVDITLETFVCSFESRADHLPSVAALLRRELDPAFTIDWLDEKGDVQDLLRGKLARVGVSLKSATESLIESYVNFNLIDNADVKLKMAEFCNHLFSRHWAGGELKKLFASKGPNEDSRLPILQLTVMLKAMLSYASANDERVLIANLLEDESIGPSIKFNIGALDVEVSDSFSDLTESIFQYAFFAKSFGGTTSTLRSRQRIEGNGRVIKHREAASGTVSDLSSNGPATTGGEQSFRKLRHKKAKRLGVDPKTGRSIGSDDFESETTETAELSKLDELLIKHLRITNKNKGAENE